jgi:hypothetical protein
LKMSFAPIPANKIRPPIHYCVSQFKCAPHCPYVLNWKNIAPTKHQDLWINKNMFRLLQPYWFILFKNVWRSIHPW